MLYPSCCPNCAHDLLEYGVPAIVLFQDICESTAPGSAPFDIPDEQIVSFLVEPKWHIYNTLKFLEEQGYVTSTELSHTSIRVKPHGCWYYDTEYMESRFCAKGGFHYVE